jgi:hypothetical protein
MVSATAQATYFFIRLMDGKNDTHFLWDSMQLQLGTSTATMYYGSTKMDTAAKSTSIRR